MEIRAGDGLVIRPLEAADAEEVYALVDANRAHLARWMPFASGETLEATREFIAGSREQLGDDDGMQAAILSGGTIVGVVGVRGIDRTHSVTEIGYWLAEDAQGSGTMTRAVRAFADHAFTAWGLNRIEIRVAVGNDRSRAVPLRLGFVHEGTLRQVERFGDEARFEDLEVYAVLAADWPVAGSPAP